MTSKQGLIRAQRMNRLDQSFLCSPLIYMSYAYDTPQLTFMYAGGETVTQIKGKRPGDYNYPRIQERRKRRGKDIFE